MALAKPLLDRAKQEKWAVGAFNVCNLEALKAVVSAAVKLRSPIIIEASDGEVNFIGKTELFYLIRVYEHQTGLPIILNLDHAPTKESCLEAISIGFDYVHFDGSKLPLAENIQITKEVVAAAHAKNILVEAEFNSITGSSADHRDENISTYQNKALYTDHAAAKQFIAETGADTLASFIGNAHGLYQNQKLIDIPRLQGIAKVLPNTYLSLHGGSGISPEDIKSAIQNGIVKINVNTELRLAYRDTLKKVLSETNEIAAYKLMTPVIVAVQQIVESKIQLFGSAGKV